LKQLWPNAACLLAWLVHYQPQMRTALAGKTRNARHVIEESWYDPEALVKAIKAGDDVLGRHFTRKRRKH
ncbi:MAG TPA: hypothetical protein VK963_04410, partial [Candidatus Saccharimonadales bacterium]|nr:hypothetical protein [Candidatus Saccharimonadales bacterium]